MALEDYLPKTPDPNAPKTLDLSLCRQLIARAPKFSMQPAGDTIREFAEQLKLAMDDIAGTSTRIVNAQNDALRYQREADTANNEVRVANQALLAARDEIAALKAKVPVLKQDVLAAVDVAPKKKRGPNAKVVPMQTEPAKVAK